MILFIRAIDPAPAYTVVFTVDEPEQRLRQMQKCCPVPLELTAVIPGSLQTLKRLQQEFDYSARHWKNTLPKGWWSNVSDIDDRRRQLLRLEQQPSVSLREAQERAKGAGFDELPIPIYVSAGGHQRVLVHDLDTILPPTVPEDGITI